MGALRKLSPEAERELAQRYRAGESPTRLSAAFGLTLSAVWKVAQRNGVVREQKSWRLPRVQRECIAAQFLAGEDTRQIASSHAIRLSTVRRMVLSEGLVGQRRAVRAAQRKANKLLGRLARDAARAEAQKPVPKVRVPRRREWLSTAKQMYERGEKIAAIGLAVGRRKGAILDEVKKSGWQRLAMSCATCGEPVPPSRRAFERSCADCTSARLTANKHRRRRPEVDDGTLDKVTLRRLFATAKRCPYCWHQMKSKDKSLDHMEPISRGGKHSIGNVIVCCLRCNMRKRDLPFHDWLGMIPVPCERALSGGNP